MAKAPESKGGRGMSTYDARDWAFAELGLELPSVGTPRALSPVTVPGSSTDAPAGPFTSAPADDAGSSPKREFTSPMATFDRDRMLALGSTTNIRDSVLWVLDHCRVADLEPEDAPSPAAFFLYLEIRDDPAMRRDFIKTFVPRMMPSASAIDRMADMLDDGEGIIEGLELVARAAKVAKGVEPEETLVAGSA